MGIESRGVVSAGARRAETVQVCEAAHNNVHNVKARGCHSLFSS